MYTICLITIVLLIFNCSVSLDIASQEMTSNDLITLFYNLFKRISIIKMP